MSSCLQTNWFRAVIKQMNKLTLTNKGVAFFNQETASICEDASLQRSSRSSSLPHLASTATLSQKQEVNQQLSRLGSQLHHLQSKGLQRILLEREEKLLGRAMGQVLTGRRDYLRELVPALVRRTREGLRVGNMSSRLERGRAYIDRLQFNFENKFVFRPPKKQEEQ